jgi:hypothetical protein
MIHFSASKPPGVYLVVIFILYNIHLMLWSKPHFYLLSFAGSDCLSKNGAKVLLTNLQNWLKKLELNCSYDVYCIVPTSRRHVMAMQNKEVKKYKKNENQLYSKS